MTWCRRSGKCERSDTNGPTPLTAERQRHQQPSVGVLLRAQRYQQTTTEAPRGLLENLRRGARRSRYQQAKAWRCRCEAEPMGKAWSADAYLPRTYAHHCPA
jgi:hypothetical protein